MLLNKKLAAIAAALAICGSGYASAAPQIPQLNNGGFGVGAAYSLMAYGNSFNLLLSYANPYFSADLGAGYSLSTNTSNYSYSSYNNNFLNVIGDVGLRNRLNETNLFLTYGISAGYGSAYPNKSNSGANHNNAYQVGVYTGLDYQPIQHIVISGKILPYAYASEFGTTHSNNFFITGLLSVSYVF